MTIAERIDQLTSALWTFGPPSALYLDPDSLAIVASGTHQAVVALAREIGHDTAACDAAIEAIRGFVASRSSDPADQAQADKVARALRRGVLAAQVRRHPRARNFGGLVSALLSGRASKAQIALARQLAAEAA